MDPAGKVKPTAFQTHVRHPEPEKAPRTVEEFLERLDDTADRIDAMERRLGPYLHLVKRR